MSETYRLVAEGRNKLFAEGERKLRSFLPKDAPLKLVLYFNGGERRNAGHYGQWLVRPRILLEGHPPMDFEPEPLDVFPSDELIATLMLLVG